MIEDPKDDVVLSDEVAIVATGKRDESKPFDVLGIANGQSLADIRDQYQRIIYVVDESGSMGSRMEREEGHDEVYVISRIEAVKKYMKEFVDQRFAKFPEAQVALYGFGGSCHVRCYAGSSKDQVQVAVSNLSSWEGSTNITGAVKAGMTDVRQARNRASAHHLILVSDGCDGGAVDVKEMLPDMKRLGVVFDFIFVRGEDDYVMKEVREILKHVCEETGGEFIEVSKASEFKAKFFEVSNRLALPAGKS